MLLITVAVSSKACNAKSVKIPRTRHQTTEQHRVIFQLGSDHVYHPLCSLDHATHAEQTSVQHCVALAAGEIVPHHDVDRAEFVLERKKDHPGGGAGALTAGHQPGDPYGLFKRPSLQTFRGTEAELREPLAQYGKRMADERAAELGHSR